MYESLVKEFESKGNFKLLKGQESSFDWPHSSGVYAVWDVSSIRRVLLYVGMTGKYSRVGSEVVFNTGVLSKRSQRWTPYRFCESKMDGDLRYTFRFGPKLSNTNAQASIKYDSDAYGNTVRYENIEIDCFIIEANDSKYTPTLVEAMILADQIKKGNSLPPANNEH